VSELNEGILKLEGEGFNLIMKYNSKAVTPKIEFNKVTDSKLKTYWPGGITRIVFEIKNQKLKGKNQIIIENMR
jgi:hypothetical protein